MDIDLKRAEPLDAAAPSTTPASAREHGLTVLFGLWMMIGLFLDGYFHQNLDSDGESFFTPWHGLFYSGFIATAWWLATLARRRTGGQMDPWLRSLPPGYELARIGLALFAIGGVGDAAWHTGFGVEKGIDALLSPTHLVLFVGLALILSAPVRAASAHAADDVGWVVVGALVSTTALVGFFTNFVWGLGISELTAVAYDPITESGEVEVIAGVASALVTTAILFVAARQLLALGRARPGSALVLFGVVSVLVAGAFDEDFEGVIAAVAAGAVIEILARRATSVQARAGVFAAASGVLWLVYFGLLGAADVVAWQSEIWLGATVASVLLATVIGWTSSTDSRSPAA